MKNNNFSAYSQPKTHSSAFFQLPDFLLFDEPYSSMSNDAKLLYAILLRRLSLSKKNHAETGGWQDEYGIFLLCARTEMMRLLNCSENKVRRLIAELQNCGLLMEKRQGLNRPNRIYIYQMTAGIAPKTEGQEGAVLASPKPPKQRPNQKEKQVNKIKLYSPSANTLGLTNGETAPGKTEEEPKTIFPEQKDCFSKPMAYLRSCQHKAAEHTMRKRCLAYLIDILSDAQCQRLKGAHIMGHYRTARDIEKRLAKLDQMAIDGLLDSLDQVDRPIRHPRAYLLSALYQAPENAVFYCHRNMQQSSYSMHTHKTEVPFIEGELLAAVDILSAI